MDATLEHDATHDSVRDDLIRRIIEKYRPGLQYKTGVVAPEGDYYGEYEPDSGLVFTTECDNLSDTEMAYVVCHEIAHALTDTGHDANFYGVLTALVIAEEIPWSVAVFIEGIIPRLWERHASA